MYRELKNSHFYCWMIAQMFLGIPLKSFKLKGKVEDAVES
jgi:hypothetical protein